MVAEDGFDVFHQVIHAGAGFGRKILFDIKLAEGFADVRVNHMGGALPAGFLLGLAAENRAVEGERFGFCGGVEIGRGGVQDMPAQVGFPILQRALLHQRVQGGEKVGLMDDHVGQGRNAGGVQESAQGQVRIFCDGIGDGEFVVIGDGIAQIGARFAGFGQGRFQFQNGGGVRFRPRIPFHRPGQTSWRCEPDRLRAWRQN